MTRRPGLREVGEDPDPRFSFANERTFLAWIQASLAVVAGGIAVTQLLPASSLDGARRLLGLPLILLGALMAFSAYGRWEASERALRLRQSLPGTWLLRVVAIAVAAIAVLAAVLVATTSPE